MPGSIDPIRDLWREWNHADASPRPFRALRLFALFLLHALLGFVEALSDFAAPVLLIVGIAWWAAPALLGAIHLDGPGAELLAFVTARLPTGITLGGTYLSAHALIVDGLTMFAVAAVCRTAGLVVGQAMIEVDR